MADRCSLNRCRTFSNLGTNFLPCPGLTQARPRNVWNTGQRKTNSESQQPPAGEGPPRFQPHRTTTVKKPCRAGQDPAARAGNEHRDPSPQPPCAAATPSRRSLRLGELRRRKTTNPIVPCASTGSSGPSCAPDVESGVVVFARSSAATPVRQGVSPGRFPHWQILLPCFSSCALTSCQKQAFRPLGCLPLELNHHVVKKPKPHGKSANQKQSSTAFISKKDSADGITLWLQRWEIICIIQVTLPS
ncbi:uncharacterized protein LOC124961365 [Sciurus carolinensis]|uniref:uncharacterized protein LOC124961365 n=1 Tax=Sciurus carolinensis TaxID=30640 RepID=UPI001FB4542F|nr:uncharacterized protein LOC124961365 [Sciurus carolinensis]